MSVKERGEVSLGEKKERKEEEDRTGERYIPSLKLAHSAQWDRCHAQAIKRFNE
jgi:hypothetical protein